MSDIQALQSLNPLVNNAKLREVNFSNDQKTATSAKFGDTIKDFLNAVNNTQQEAGTKVADVVQGKSEDIADAMIAVEESRVSFELMLEIRNKLLESYKEIQRMQV
ncbi:MAG: flagellar hook-basal body complex protein FliE [Calditrichaeota bacterium]|nr:flagellar hook-basal body complex protein FliE [Calditrichota bacterium]MBT7789756.1 flagellar hook-basal body complex protein FliE [Calditrichota bacterium]